MMQPAIATCKTEHLSSVRELTTIIITPEIVTTLIKIKIIIRTIAITPITIIITTITVSVSLIAIFARKLVTQLAIANLIGRTIAQITKNKIILTIKCPALSVAKIIIYGRTASNSLAASAHANSPRIIAKITNLNQAITRKTK